MKADNFSTKMGTRLHAIREACGLDNEMRTEENIDDILGFVKDVKFFSRLSVLQQRSLCRTMSLEEFGPREFVFQMGESGDKFYIILSGSVGVQVPSQTAPCPTGQHTEKCDCPGRPLETIVFLEKGMGFGELALQSDQPRSATIQTSEKTELLVTKRADYEMYAGQQHRQFIEQRVKFLRQIPRIEDSLQRGSVSTQDIAAMANCLNEVQLSGNAVVCRQGDAVDHVIFVRAGQLATLRCVDVNKCEQASKPSKPSLASIASKTSRKGTTVDGTNAPGKGNKEADSRRESEMNFQPQWQLTQNLAKAMMDMKRADRKVRLEATMEGKEDESVSSQASPSASGTDNESITKRMKSVVLAQGLGAELLDDDESEDSEKEFNKMKATAHWNRLRMSVKGASALDKLIGSTTKKEEPKPDTSSPKKLIEESQSNVQHFAEVQAARRRYRQYTCKQKSQNERKSRQSMATMGRRSILSRRDTKISRAGSRTTITTVTSNSSKYDANGNLKKRVRILRIGTLGPYEYFGAQQVGGSEKYPVSLVSDPVAEIYVMSKNDILRRVPKKLFSAFFHLEKDAVPSDIQLLDMHRQTERWNSFRRNMHGEALSSLTARNQMMRGGEAGSKIDAVANLEFLGINPSSNLGESLLRFPQNTFNRGVVLKPKDEELFSQASARFLRGFDIMKRDPELREALSVAGLMRNERLHDGLPGSSLDDDDQDPMAFRFDQHWYKLQKDPVGLDLDDVFSIGDDAASKQNASQSVASMSVKHEGSSGGRSSVKGRRGSMLTDAHANKRGSAVVMGGSSRRATDSFSDASLAEFSDYLPPARPRGFSRTGAMPNTKRRQSVRRGKDADSSHGAGHESSAPQVELPPVDSARDDNATRQNSARRTLRGSKIISFATSDT